MIVRQPRVDRLQKEGGRLAPDWEKGDGDGGGSLTLTGKEPSLPLTFESVCPSDILSPCLEKLLLLIIRSKLRAENHRKGLE